MNALLCLALGLLATATLCHGQCMMSLPEIDPVTGEPVPGCRDDEGVLHNFGSTWNNKRCYACSCNKYGAQCCNRIPTYFGLPNPVKLW
ncbi:small serum protein 3-like isoform X2 [Erpetoichthys calabaricus]|uniref:small serum protein 3-like isoform X2 n=1 Tax=Erpetoichthys calabaricus TaxID=27687 RepID=UPI002234A199|nr:small serum protein 3-like isoform X2 [Erpetoichthys calabaricus]